ncbi:unnamed protein product [Heterobilharzia americana]|nr:unnamed protein product [Heterobilharzia americana]
MGYCSVALFQSQGCIYCGHVFDMNGGLYDDSDDEYYDCQSEASPRDKGSGEVFVDPKKAYLKLRGIKGARLKLFSNHVDANKYASTPVDEDKFISQYPPSPKPDVESSPYPSVSQQTLIRFRSLVNSGNIDDVKRMIDENPMVLVTSSDTPTILQIRFRYNALHVIAANGNVGLLRLLLDYFDCEKFWQRLYPNATKEASYWRQQYVLDLYLNSPELGNYETPLHFASKYGHVDCVSILARHPLTKINLVNVTGQTPADVAASRLINQKGMSLSCTDSYHNLADRIRQALNESYIVLADIKNLKSTIIQTKILPPLDTRKFQALLSHFALNSCKTFTNTTTVKPYCCIHNFSEHSNYHSRKYIENYTYTDDFLTYFECEGQLHRLRGFSGPMSLDKAVQFRKKWLQYNMPNSVHCKPFACLRLTDAERGYERQGRYLSHVFKTKWYEYWEFLDDYIDLSSEDGLSALENYLSNYPSLNIEHFSQLNHNHEDYLNNITSRDSSDCGSSSDNNMLDISKDSNQISYLLTPTSALLFGPNSNNNNDNNSIHDNDVFTPETPIIRLKSKSNNNTKDEFSKSINQHWLSYRQDRGCIHELNDSLEESFDKSDSSIPYHEEKSDGGDTSTNRIVAVSPIVGLLKRLTFISPTYWLKRSNHNDENDKISSNNSLTTDYSIAVNESDEIYLNQAYRINVEYQKQVSSIYILRLMNLI